MLSMSLAWILLKVFFFFKNVCISAYVVSVSDLGLRFKLASKKLWGMSSPPLAGSVCVEVGLVFS
jgi:hypothetical protein